MQFRFSFKKQCRKNLWLPKEIKAMSLKILSVSISLHAREVVSLLHHFCYSLRLELPLLGGWHYQSFGFKTIDNAAIFGWINIYINFLLKTTVSLFVAYVNCALDYNNPKLKKFYDWIKEKSDDDSEDEIDSLQDSQEDKKSKDDKKIEDSLKDSDNDCDEEPLDVPLLNYNMKIEISMKRKKDIEILKELKYYKLPPFKSVSISGLPKKGSKLVSKFLCVNFPQLVKNFTFRDEGKQEKLIDFGVYAEDLLKIIPKVTSIVSLNYLSFDKKALNQIFKASYKTKCLMLDNCQFRKFTLDRRASSLGSHLVIERLKIVF